MKILKFGGTSVATPERVQGVVSLVADAAREGPLAVVVSAFGGVTNDLVAVANLAVASDPQWSEVLDRVAVRHLEAARALASADEQASLAAFVGDSFAELRGLLRGASLVRECTPRTLDSVMSYGERLSAPLVAAAFRARGIAATAFDTRSLILTDKRFGAARVRLPESYARIRESLSGRHAIPVLAGFVAATEAGETTTLGRGGSDYTAALVGAALDSPAIEIWTDVDGVMSADPRIVSGAFSIPAMTYDELMEMSHFGAKVVYPPTIHPARAKGIPLIIRNTLNPAFPGTAISAQQSANAFDVRGITSVPRVALLRLEGDGMVGVPGIAMRLFGALANESISAILITQSSSEHSICFAIDPGSLEQAVERLQAEFALERAAGLVDDVVVEDDVALIAVVGAGMHERPGIAGRLFGALGAAGVNIRAISQGSSELNITVAVKRADEAAAVRAVHQVFFGAAGKAAAEPVALALAGPGRVGAALLDQLAARRAELEAAGIQLSLVGLSRSRGGTLAEGGIPLDAWREQGPGGAPLAEVVRALSSRKGRRIFVDCTASDEPTAFYQELLQSGVAVIAANKRAFAGSPASWQGLCEAARHGLLLHEATVGAGLPILSTLADLVATGDTVTRIEGCLSGTIAFLMSRLGESASFSEAVREAHGLGYTEPDPREDLGGVDAGRKLLILARVAGLPAGEVQVESLLPGRDWNSLSQEQFWAALPELDEHYRELARVARAANCRLSFVASASEAGLEAGLRLLDESHPCFSLSGTQNLIAFWTRRYAEAPLVVRGPGAGPEVTASAVFSDILKAARSR